MSRSSVKVDLGVNLNHFTNDAFTSCSMIDVQDLRGMAEGTITTKEIMVQPPGGEMGCKWGLVGVVRRSGWG